MKFRPGPQSSSSAGVQTSPATTRVVSFGSALSEEKACRTAGGKVTWVIPRAFIVCVNGSPGVRSWLEAMHNCAPEHKVTKISDTDASKLADANCSTRLSG